MVIQISSKRGQACQRSVPYAIPLREPNIRVAERVGTQAVSQPHRNWPWAVVGTGTVLLALAASIRLTHMFSHGRTNDEITQPSSTQFASSPIPRLPEAPAGNEHKESSQDSAPLKSTTPGKSATPRDGHGKNSADAQLPLRTATTGSVGGGGQPTAVLGDEEAPAVPPRQRETVIHATAIFGSPVGVGKVEMLFRDDQCPAWNADLPLCVDDLQHRVRFPAVDVIVREPNGGSPHRIRHAVAYFLFLGREPLTMRVASPGSTWVESYTIHPLDSVRDGREVLRGWSLAYGRHAKDASGPAGFVRQLTWRVLSRRLSLGERPYPAGVLKDRPMAALEKSFERSLSTLLGIDSLLLAVPDVPDADAPQWREEAKLPLPVPMNLPEVQIPPSARKTPIEKLAFQVPQDCFYVRCQRTGHLAWLRGFITAWGGNLQDIISLPVLDYGVRVRLEEQLALGLQRSQELGIDETIDDMALVGADFFFQEGAAVGVVFQAQVAPRLHSILQQQRKDVKLRHASAQETTLNIDGHKVEALTTADNSVRSFYTVKGDFHFVTNSLRLLKQFLAIDGGQGSLGHLAEYRYAREQQQADQEWHRILIYLSDPFFRRLATPHYRIELLRRAQSLAEMHEFAVASRVATSLGQKGATAETLVAMGYLPPTFARRDNDVRIAVVNNHVVDLVRGRRGMFLPIPDIQLQTATQSELSAYEAFATQYQQQWGRVDPLTVTLGSKQDVGQTSEHVLVRIQITPYARQRYAFFTRHLGPPTTEHVQSVDGDVLRVDAALRDSGGKPYQAHLALQDQNVTYRIENGRLVRTDSPENVPFSTTNQYVAVTPGGTDGLRLVHQFVTDLQHGPNTAGASVLSPNVRPLLGLLAFLLGADSSRFFSEAFATDVQFDNSLEWSIFARDKQIRQQVRPQLQTTHARNPAQVRLALSDPNRASVGPYLHAYAYLASRQASGLATQMLNDLTGHFGMSPQQGLETVHWIFDAAPVCPLKGSFKWTEAEPCGFWTSSAWHELSVFELQEVPSEYRFPFLDWLRGATVEFALTGTTLSADVALQVKQESAGLAPANPLTTADNGGHPPVRPADVNDASEPLSPGDQVVVSVDHASLRIGAHVEMKFPRDTTLTVIEVRGDWVGVLGFPQGMARRGWVHSRELVRR
ncbi:MAG: hypothetical protein ACYC4U_08405 [Pirellulaceae bacterium]